MKKYLIILGGVVCFFLFPAATHAASIYLSPASGSFAQGSTFSVSVRVNTASSATNTAEANLSFSSNLQLVTVRQGATYYLSAPGSPSKGSGTAYFGGGLPTPGYNGSGGTLGTMTFRALSQGTATVSVSSGKVLLNDGNGTDAFSGGSTATFRITAPVPTTPTATSTDLAVTSSTHPDQNSWYAKPDVQLSWNRPDGAYGFSFELDQSPETIPDNTLDTTVTTTKSYPGLKDGTWYFHIKSRAQAASAPFGSVAHFKIQIDTVKPLPFDAAIQNTTITFNAKDETSDIGHYEILVDNQLIESNASSPFTLPKLANGEHLITVIAYDKAGNSSKSEFTAKVEAASAVGFLQKNLQVPLYAIVIFNLVALVLIILLIWFVLSRRRKIRKPGDDVAQLQEEIDQSLEDLKQRISKKLLIMTSRSNRELYDREEEVAKDVALNVAKTRRKIDKGIVKISKKVKKQKLKE